MRLDKPVLFLLLILLFTTSCAKKTEDTVQAHYYPSCHEPLAYLHSRTGGTGKAVATGAVQGGVISGIATAIVGAITGNLRPVGVLAGVAAGGAVGGLVGGVNQHQNIERADNQHLAKYLEEVDGDISNMDIVQAAATVSKQCYAREFATLTREMREGKIEDSAALARYTEIVAGTKEADQLLGEKLDASVMQNQFDAAKK